ncbi:cbb3-type cytochrome c oxidase subunit 3 [Maricaulis parjimensis]|uniref:cbb3-type cytochrome c oxidase subunit 3 n=1 Tax=Maricaulis parjimensis TaxID=144023 RepID=UPI00193978DA|nr:cbb3-type cytochrome c oxidase subunit 3 [Maricaulis parjimensis]
MHETLSIFAQTGGLLIFVFLFAGVVAYALWPRNQARFDAAANTPLTESDTPATSGQNEDGIHVR